MEYDIITKINCDASKVYPYKVEWNVLIKDEILSKRLNNIYTDMEGRMREMSIWIRPKILVKLGLVPIKLNLPYIPWDGNVRNLLDDNYSFKDVKVAKAFELEYKRFINIILQREIKNINKIQNEQ